MATPTIGFIGYGNMAQAMATGMINAGSIDAAHVIACAAHYDKLTRTAAVLGIQPKQDAREVAQQADIIVIAIKPHLIESVLAPLSDELNRPGVIIISLAAGWNLERYRQLLGERAHIQCIIPNTAMQVGKGIVIAETAHTLSDDEQRQLRQLLEPTALIEYVDTVHMDIAMCVAGCAPAFTAMYIEALSDAGVKYGLSREAATRLASAMVEGVGALQLATGMHPGAMKDAVCSPGGTTIRGVAALEQHGLRGAVIAAVEAIEA